MSLFPWFILVIIVNLLWLIQFIAEIHSDSIVIWLNVWMILSWLLFCFAYYKSRKQKSSVYIPIETPETEEELIDKETPETPETEVELIDVEIT
tara:strand:+ start:3481 stop:3762 length:282 start_codon:yes stop_codon:yes gene_type:complete